MYKVHLNYQLNAHQKGLRCRLRELYQYCSSSSDYPLMLKRSRLIKPGSGIAGCILAKYMLLSITYLLLYIFNIAHLIHSSKLCTIVSAYSSSSISTVITTMRINAITFDFSLSAAELIS